MSVAVVDIGGTAIKTGIYKDEDISHFKEVPSKAKDGVQALMAQVVSLLETMPEKFDRIGISTAGQVDSSRGVITYANSNIPGYTGFPLKEFLEDKFSIPVTIENDVNAAAIGEAKFGAGKDKTNNTFLCLTYGTGIGGAIVINNNLYYGSSFSAAEFGAIIIHAEDRINSSDPWDGSYERYASTTALIKRVCEKHPDLNNGKKIFSNLNNEEVKKEVDLWINEVVFGLISLTHIFNPSMIVVGGGIMNEGYIIEQLNKKLNANIMPSYRNVEIHQAKLQNKAGLYGAGWLSMNNI
ncbi:MAG: ROK family protein [Clostridiaceae bacterium]|nr:ROK family protein [Clostridiaceae bacterium]